ncbi:DNA polymerase [Drosophila suzukii associated hytrosavirus 1]|nr:DNA polymerase [Drosophila suzukii associated hytrosavirus 1]
MIRSIYQYAWSDDNDDDEEDDYKEDTKDKTPINTDVDDFDNNDFDSGGNDKVFKYYMINDIKINASNNSKIKINLSLMDEFGQKVYKVIQRDIYFDVYIQAFNNTENITQYIDDIQYFNNTPEFINHKYTAMGYSSQPLNVWRLNINRNKLEDIYDFCKTTKRKMFLNTELNDALPLVQKSLGIYIKITDTNNTYISYFDVMKAMPEEISHNSYICRKVSVDIEVLSPSYWTRFPEATEKGCEIIIIACTFQHNEEPYESIILYTDPKKRTVNIKEDPTVKRTFVVFNDEMSMLKYFIDMISPMKVDLLTGWNVRNFDLKYIYDRCMKFYPDLVREFRKWTLNHNDITFRDTVRKGLNITLVDCFGIIVLDMYDYNKSNVKAKSYKLKDIAKTYLQDNKQKLAMEYKDITRFYNEGTNEQFSQLLEYCSVDAEIVLDLMAVQKVWNNTISMADICHVPINFVINHGVMLRNTCMISEFINTSTDYLLPYKHEHPFLQYEGGFVNEPIVGFHTNPIFVLDFNSLYPTTMLAFNICTTTIVHLDELEVENINEDPQELDELVYTKDDIQLSKTPYMKNVGFVSSTNRKGVMPQILDNLLKTRKRIQGELKQTTCPRKRKQLDAQQLTYKLCANAIYGLLGCSFSPLYNPEVAASVTGFGRFLSFIKRKCIVRYLAEDNITGKIIYGDTDSVMVEVENHSLEETKNIAIRYAERITKDIGINPIRTEYEKIFCPFLIHKKKHYIGVMYTNNCQTHDRIEYKGNEMVRSDNCSLTTSVMKEVINVLFFHGHTIDEKLIEIECRLENILESWSQLYMLYRNKENVPRSLLDSVIKMAIYSKKLSKETYKNRLPHVAVYERTKNMKQYHLGDRIIFCIANTEFTDKIKPKNIIDMAYDIDEFLNDSNLYLSIHYYLDSCIRKPLYRLFETLDSRFKQRLEQKLLSLFPPLQNLKRTA